MPSRERRMGVKNPRWFPFDVPKWLLSESIKDMPLDAEGIYIRLLGLQWEHGHVPGTAAGVLSSLRKQGRRIREDRFNEIWTVHLERRFPVTTASQRANPLLAALRVRAVAGELVTEGFDPDALIAEAENCSPATPQAQPSYTPGAPEVQSGVAPVQMLDGKSTESLDRGRQMDGRTGVDGVFPPPMAGGDKGASLAGRPPDVEGGDGSLAPAKPKRDRPPKTERVETKPEKKAMPPMPFSIADALSAIRPAVLVDPFPPEPKYPTNLNRLIRQYPDLSTWRRIADRLAAGGDGWGGGRRGKKPDLWTFIRFFGSWAQLSAGAEPPPAASRVEPVDEPQPWETEWQREVFAGLEAKRGQNA